MAVLFALSLSYLSPYISPDSFLWPIAFTGLIYPILLLVNTLFFIYWTISFKRHAWANLVIILLGYGHIEKLIKIQDNNTPFESEFSVMSYNVRLFNVYNWIEDENIKENIISYINTTNSSVVCIQEFYAAYESPKLNYQHSHIGIQNDRKKWRMATYSKYPIINKGTVSINGEFQNNVCIFSDIVILTDTIRFYNVHLASNWFQKEDYQFLDKPTVEGAENIIERLKVSFSKRAKQVKAIKKHMDTSIYPIILCGDFNDTPNSYAYKQLSEGLTDSFVKSGKGMGKTYNGKFPALRIDYIMYSPEIDLGRFETTKQNLSDHYPVISYFKKN